MVGMLLAGAAPIDAVRLQLVLLYVLLGGVSIAALVAVLFAQRAFFTSAHQLGDLTDVAEQLRARGGRRAPRAFRPSLRRAGGRRGA